MSKPRIVVSDRDQSVIVRLRNVRLSFPALFKPRAFEEGKDPVYQATFLMLRQGDPEKNLEYVKQGIALVVKNLLRGVHPGADRVPVKSGKEKGDRGVDGYSAEIAYLAANNKNRTAVVDRNKVTLDGKDGRPYGGCYVNASVRLWAMDGSKNPKWGKRVCAQLLAVQFWADGEPFGAGAVDPDDEFDEGGEDGGEGAPSEPTAEGADLL